MGDLADLRIPDVATFLAVARLGSITSAARDQRVTPSQVSKAVARLENVLGRTLLSRRARGVVLTEEASAVIPALDDLVTRARNLAEEKRGEPRRRVTIATPSYLGSFVPRLVTAVPDVRIRTLEVGLSFIRGYATEGLFDLALTLGAERLAPGWAATRVAAVRRGLFASPRLAKSLGPKPTPTRLRAVPFVTPVYQSSNQLLPGDDGCPIPRSERIIGHEAATAAMAFELAAVSDQLAFGPVLAAQTLVQAGALVEIRVTGWKLVDDLYLHAHEERVLAAVQKAMIEALRSTPQD
jgi:DNA-binding transcriptional LysR family regulator